MRIVLLFGALALFLGGVAFFEKHPKLLDILVASASLGAVTWITWSVVNG